MNRDLFNTIVQNNSIKLKRYIKDYIPSGDGLMNQEAIYSLNNFETNLAPFQGLPTKHLTLSHIISYYDSLECLLELYRFTDDLNVKSADGISPFIYAILGQSIECAQFLFSMGVNVNETAFGKTPLYLATKTGNYMLVKYILDLGAMDPESDAKNKFNPIVVAIKQEKIDILKLLLSYGYSLEYSVVQSPIFQAIRLGLDNGVELLLKFGCNVNFRKETGEFPLMFAIQLDKPEIVKLLLKWGADAKLVGPNQASLMHICAETGNIGLMNLLLKKGVVCDTVDIQGKFPTFYALSAQPLEKATKAIDFLVNHGIDINSTDNQGRTVLSEAISNPSLCKPEFISFLIDKGADPTMRAPGTTGKTILSEATDDLNFKSSEVLQILKNGCLKVEEKMRNAAEKKKEQNTVSEISVAISLQNRLRRLIKKTDQSPK
ncbi:hypothetical protein TVAG_237170 [Trichomonas vaginalis G3]|uniref:Uncharacterized protein n=1 Tax=Trichomonas vaginalis (strain ATCC PRA-98 / G3) TaxID=412133 RepID=A2DCR7_TRIV3|nr:spectrin binding [Trichomonas vaginalis G3]EAY21691.1 hypothetical protein TVAG_237170 [Trichomonas vaginalis G3]KAI5524329.1 spectrin binding [Trichomonas vaginalis G3]|eukprot:XP_001582677.1 hypothetical protein [Trichomonas vaginalis G3]